MGSAGKTHIDLPPFAKDIAQVVSSLANGIPTCHGMGFAIESYSGRGGRDEKSNSQKLPEEIFDRKKDGGRSRPMPEKQK